MHYMRGKSRGDNRTFRYQPPSEEEYRLTLTFVSTLNNNSDAKIELKRAREDDIENYPHAKRLGVHSKTYRPQTAAILQPLASPAPSPPTKVSKQPFTATVTASATTPKKAVPTPRVRAIPRAAPGEGGRTTHAAATHTRIREPKKPIDLNWRAIPDYAPSNDILGDNPRALKVDWDGNALDLSEDPDREFLHPAELHLASLLRLTGARYLTCKRRIFVQRVEALKQGKEFKKTDAQQACQIDVNKASKIWMAYDRIGWLQPQLFKQYL